MDKIIKTKDSEYKISFRDKTYFLEKKMGAWYNKSWQPIYRTVNKTMFIKHISRVLV
jgi:hypothetical protein